MCNIPFKDAREYIMKLINMDIKDYKPFVNPVHKESDYPPIIENVELERKLQDEKIEFSKHFEDRFLRCRGQSPRDFYVLRFGKFKRIPDLVIWVKNQEQVEKIVQLANKYLAIIIPYGGGTNVVLALSYNNLDNQRLFISLDTSLMNRILWIDRVSMLACMESGIAGKDLEDALGAEGLTLGHEPDSIEFSTLGGWVATRSSGMKQQTYGNIEEMVSKITFVTSVGVMEKKSLAPRSSIGPDFDHIILGSEGTLGIITKVVVHIRNAPAVRRYGSIMFPDFESGTKFMHEVSKFTTKPSNLRLVDNFQFQIGNALRHNKNLFGDMVDFVKKHAASIFYGFNMDKVAIATYLIEGEEEEVNNIEAKLKDVAYKHWGLYAGPKYGERAYLMTLTVCYIRVNMM
jgi:alkyldihydroxyacetonephosphate synthase